MNLFCSGLRSVNESGNNRGGNKEHQNHCGGNDSKSKNATWISYLEGESLFALRLPEDDDDTDATEQTQNGGGHHDACMASQQLREAVSQDGAQDRDEDRCRDGRQGGS